MARQRRVELEGGLYHVIARGNNRQDIFHSDEDHKKFLSLLSTLKQKLPFIFTRSRPRWLALPQASGDSKSVYTPDLS